MSEKTPLQVKVLHSKYYISKSKEILVAKCTLIIKSETTHSAQKMPLWLIIDTDRSMCKQHLSVVASWGGASFNSFTCSYAL